MKTWVLKASDIKRDWYVIDAEGKNLGRLASQIATILRGKHKPIYTPSMDVGDFVIVVNAAKIQVTGNKMREKKYYRHSLHPGGLSTRTLQEMLAKHPERVIRLAVRGMLPKTKLGRTLIRKLKVYADGSHPHQAQQPKPLELSQDA
ncbi:MAG: 50S ribosomal protein L13 [Chloroflexi bacterium]|nr:50S ribosomal protein L13 [Chloroflexota bacterium]